jgi:hypothetical protein
MTPVRRSLAHVAVYAAAVAAVPAVPVTAQVAQPTPFPRLPAAVLDVRAPGEWTRGAPGAMSVGAAACRTLAEADARRRIVDIAVQEWGFFGFRVAAPDEDEGSPDPTASLPAGSSPSVGGAGAPATGTAPGFPGRRRSRLPPDEAARVASSIAGYWAATPEGTWIVARQNDAWRGEYGVGARWEYPWSAAFVSWVMCEAGIGASARFQRAVAHHTYIDQAIRARDGRAPQAMYAAYDAGEAPVEPGDLLCTSRRPVYRSLAERRRQPGVGARTHCDIVVQVDEGAMQIAAIGGNVRGVVALKRLPASRGAHGLRPLDRSASPTARPVFAHLKLGGATIGARGLDTSATIRAIACSAVPPAASLARATGITSPRTFC